MKFIDAFLVKQSYSDLSNEDKATLIVYLISIAVALIVLSINIYLGLVYPRNVSLAMIVSLLIGIHVYFNLKRYFLSSLLVILFLNVLTISLNLIQGLTPSYFLYSFVMLSGIPFMSKRDDNYLRNSLILSGITVLFAIVSIILSPQYNSSNISEVHANQKLITNSIMSLLLFLIFTFLLVRSTSRYVSALVRGRMKAEKEKDTKTRVLSNLGHELRTQINSINGITQLILDQNNSNTLTKTELKKYSETLDLCNQQMLYLVDDILDIHKIESGKFELNNKPVVIGKLLDEIILPFTNKVEEKGLFLEVNIDEVLKSKTLLLDTSRLTQVLQNLISNAIKFTQKGFVNFTARVLKSSEETITVKFSVRDSGHGISKKNLDKIFDSFQQIVDTENVNIGGTGLGLAISSSIVEKMNSRIQVASKPNVGSDFNFTVTFKIVASEAFQSQNKINTEEEVFKGKKVLVTEDNKISMLFALKQLEKYGINTLKANNGKKAVDQVIENNDIDLVLLDLEMPEMNGFTAIQKIKAINTKVKVIAFTANIPDEALHERLDNLKFDGFLAKPYKNDELLKILKTYLN